MRLGIVAQRGNDRAAELASELCDELEGEPEVEVAVDEDTAAAIGRPGVPIEEMTAYPLVVSVGGDGTFLHTARHVGSTPVLGVNLGEVGFLNAVSPNEAADRVREEVERVRERGSPRFREVGRVEAAGEGWSIGPGLNEITVQGPHRGHGHGVDVEVRVAGSLYTSGHADGVLVATPTGSTAYNLSEGGPLVHPSIAGVIVNEMCAPESMPPLVVAVDREVSIRATGPDEIVVTCDGSERRWIETPANVTVGVADEPARIAGPQSDFFRALNKID